MNDVLHYQSLEKVSRGALAELLFLAGPTVAQMASYTVMQFVDTWMLSHVSDGVTAPAAAGNAGLLAFSVISLGMGVLWVVNTLVSQSFGRGEFFQCGRYLWQGVWFALVFAAMLLPGIPWVSHVFHGVGHPDELVRAESTYLQIVLMASVFKLVGTSFSQFLLAIDRAGAVLMCTVIGVSVNAVAAWAMIFGRLGFARMGIAGAAWGQNVGVAVEMLALVCVSFRPGIRAAYNVRDFLPRWGQLKMLLNVGIPSGVQTVADVLAWSMYSMWVMGVFGEKVMAANTFMFRYMVVSFMPAFGISVAVTALVGRYIGRGRPDLARQRAHLGFLVAGIYMLSCGLVFFLGRNVLISLFARDPEVLRTGAMLLVFAAIYQFFDAMYIIYNGALRGAGDTLVPALATAILCWGITVFGGHFIALRWTSFGPAGPWTAATAYGVILGIYMFARFQRGKWESIRLQSSARSSNDQPGSTTLPAVASSFAGDSAIPRQLTTDH
jgi:MATE family multidrug resistance protein